MLWRRLCCCCGCGGCSVLHGTRRKNTATIYPAPPHSFMLPRVLGTCKSGGISHRPMMGTRDPSRQEKKSYASRDPCCSVNRLKVKQDPPQTKTSSESSDAQQQRRKKAGELRPRRAAGVAEVFTARKKKKKKRVEVGTPPDSAHLSQRESQTFNSSHCTRVRHCLSLAVFALQSLTRRPLLFVCPHAPLSKKAFVVTKGGKFHGTRHTRDSAA